MQISHCELTNESLQQARELIREFKNKIGDISAQPERIIIPPGVACFLAERGYDTQDKIDKLLQEILSA